jgi:RNA polymerase sigma-70 factor, ECF subfamily
MSTMSLEMSSVPMCSTWYAIKDEERESRSSNSRANSAPALWTKASDNELIKAIAGGDQQAMRLLYGRHSVRVYRFALRFAADQAAAEDVLSEVFLEVWRKAGTFEGRSEVSTWLLGIARNKARQRRHSFEAWDDDVCEAVQDGADDPETAVQKKQSGSLLLNCIASLSPAHREIIDLVYYHEKSIDEVAEIIGTPRNTVKTRMFYARQQLAKKLAATGLVERRQGTAARIGAGE